MSPSIRRRLLLKAYIEKVFWIVLLALVLRLFVFVPIQIPSNSMAPSLIKGDFALAYTLPYGISLPLLKSKIGRSVLPQRGEVVLYRYELDEHSVFAKRVMGLPGDKIEIHNGYIYVNSEKKLMLNESIQMPPLLLPQGSVFLIADQPINSDDLQYWSVVSNERILGRVFLIWLSFDETKNKVRWNRIFQYVD